MTTVDIAAIRARNEARTSGVWRQGNVEKYHVFVECRDAESLGHERVLFKMNTWFDYVADAIFIAHASEDIPALLARVEELETQLVEATKARALLKEAVAIGRPHAEWNNDDKDVRRLDRIAAEGGIADE